MKAFFQRLNLTGNKDKEPSNVREKFTWPPPQSSLPTTTSSPTPTAFKPLPDIAPAQIREQLAPQLDKRSSQASHDRQPEKIHEKLIDKPNDKPSPPDPPLTRSSPQPHSDSRANHDNPPRAHPASARKINGSQYSDTQKKVAFRSPPPTPPPDRAVSPDAQASKTTVSRFQATHGVSKDVRTSSSSAGASTSRTDLGSSAKVSSKGNSTVRNTQSPYMHKEVGSNQSLRSGTPYSQMSQASGSRILAATSWSEVTEEDLVSNLGSRERTRQEVLFEIISSEERYVQELIKMKDTFIDPLLHPFSNTTSPPPATPNFEYDYYRTESPDASSDQLPPIAALFMAPTPPPGNNPHPDAESMLTDDEDEGLDTLGQVYPTKKSPPTQASKMNHPRSPYRGSATKTSTDKNNPVPFPSRSHQSLPPPPRAQMTASTHSLGRQTSMADHRGERERNYSQGASASADRKNSSPAKGNILRKFKKSTTASDNVFGIGAIAPHLLPADFKVCLEVIDGGVLEGHKRLCEALKKRYDDQFPLVRSLADVFVSNSDIFHGYATYLLHLERALGQVDDALLSIHSKKPKNQDAADYQKMCNFLRKLEEKAAERGETGLAITLSKPFQRLLKYPLLFQNLLFHTDPSTFEYESTLQMVAEVEAIVRSIEDEKIQKEERDKTRDVFARIEGLEKVRQLALPKSSRVLVEERQLGPSSSGLKGSASPPLINGKNVKGKSSFKRLNDVLHPSGIGSKRDLWLVVFNDVVLQCQRTGTTSLPLVSATNSRTNSMPELQGKAKYATTGRRNSQTKPRNLYKFIKIETWAIGDVAKPKEGVVSMDDVARTRSQAQGNQPRIVPMPDDDDDDDDMDSDDSDKKSKMSFSYWGADKVTVQKPVIKGRVVPVARRGGGAASYGRESSANAKFGTRLVSNDSSVPRPASRRTQPVIPSTRRTQTTDDPKGSGARPDWNSSTRAPITGAKRQRNVSQTSGVVRVTPSSKILSSPAPSQDSGIA